MKAFVSKDGAVLGLVGTISKVKGIPDSREELFLFHQWRDMPNAEKTFARMDVPAGTGEDLSSKCAPLPTLTGETLLFYGDPSRRRAKVLVPVAVRLGSWSVLFKGLFCLGLGHLVFQKRAALELGSSYFQWEPVRGPGRTFL